jgi:nucleoside-diphosphate-sugar epimerase
MAGPVRLVILGATGFIGRNLAEAFAADGRFEVVGVHFRRPAFDHPGIRFVRADLTRATEVDEAIAGADIVIQAAATTSGAGDIVARPHIHIADNAVMNSLVLRAAFDHKVRHLVYLSCTLMYGSSASPAKETDFDANAAFHPNYFGPGWTKVYFEKMCEFYARISDTKFTVMRHSNVYGPHDKFDLERSHVFGATVAKAMTAADGRIVVWGSGEEARDLLYVSDLVAAIRLALERQKPQFGLYNVGAGSATRIVDLVREIVRASGRPLRTEHDLSKPTIKTSVSVDCAKAREELGWVPTVSLSEGISRTLSWYRTNVMG